MSTRRGEEGKCRASVGCSHPTRINWCAFTAEPWNWTSKGEGQRGGAEEAWSIAKSDMKLNLKGKMVEEVLIVFCWILGLVEAEISMNILVDDG
jgi:hypothetical protein